MMKAPENVTLLIDAIIFFQNNISLGMLFHPPEDIFVRNPVVSRFGGIFQVGEQIIPLTLRTARSSLRIAMHARAYIKGAHQFTISLEQSGLLFFQKRQFRFA